MTAINPDGNGVSDFVSDGSRNIVTYYKGDKTFHEIREGKRCRITGKDIAIEHFTTDAERLTRFKALNLKTSDEVEARLPERYRTNAITER